MQIPHQRCWAHKTRNILNTVKRADQKALKTALHRISHAKNLITAQQAAQRFVQQWQKVYPKASACLLKDLPELLTFLRIQIPLHRKVLRTTNAIERRFKEVQRRTRPMGVFSDYTNIDRIMFSVFCQENLSENTASPFLLTHNS